MRNKLLARSLRGGLNGALGSLLPVINKQRFINGGCYCQFLLVRISESVSASKLRTKRNVERKIRVKEE